MTVSPRRYSLSDPRDRCLVQADIEVARMHSDHLLAAVTQALTRLPVDVDKGLVLVEQEETIRRVIDEAAKALLARAQLLLRPSQLRDVLQDAKLTQRPSDLSQVTSPWLWTTRRVPSGRTTLYSTS